MRRKRNVQGTFEKPAKEHQAALDKIRGGGVATRVRILASHDCCPLCRAYEGAYEFEDVPELPLDPGVDLGVEPEVGKPLTARCQMLEFRGTRIAGAEPEARTARSVETRVGGTEERGWRLI